MEIWHWGVIALAVFIIARPMIKAARHPAHKLGVQAANLNWVADGREDVDGYRSVRYRKGVVFAVVPFKDPKVLLRSGGEERVFGDFHEAEEWLHSQGIA